MATLAIQGSQETVDAVKAYFESTPAGNNQALVTDHPGSVVYTLDPVEVQAVVDLGPLHPNAYIVYFDDTVYVAVSGIKVLERNL